MTLRRTLTLLVLYLGQGLPFGFQATALKVYLYEHGVSLAGVTLAGALSAPWMLKLLWAPLVERWGSKRFGPRRSWLVPLQLGMAALASLAATLPPTREALPWLLLCVLLMNLLAATQDIAVDGLAVEWLRGASLGPGNAAQVVGFKVGMLIGGGLLVWLSGRTGWGGLFHGMALVSLLVAAVAATVQEAPLQAAHAEARSSVREVLLALLAAVKRPDAAAVLVVALTYKLGESLLDGVFKPFLLDQGLAAERIGLVLGTFGVVVSLAGSATGGWLAATQPPLRAVGIAAALRALPILAIALLATLHPPHELLLAAALAEHFFGGLLTTATFAFLMARTDPRIGGAHFTALASVEVLGKFPPSLASGLLAEQIGYAATFTTAAALSLAFLLVLPWASRRTAPTAS